MCLGGMRDEGNKEETTVGEFGILEGWMEVDGFVQRLRAWRGEPTVILVSEGATVEVFHRLPVPYVEEEYDIGSIMNDVQENNTVPASYIHIRRSIHDTVEQCLHLGFAVLLEYY
ncbi:hypothetical protein KSP39_PZI002424 [Platanthera zijinensis]|uniref:Uncharacterized protein n=1 Tax=Platanthera zijinensis TaxID=2320716 RepID=A0AAP0BYG4_9ASPA